MQKTVRAQIRQVKKTTRYLPKSIFAKFQGGVSRDISRIFWYILKQKCYFFGVDFGEKYRGYYMIFQHFDKFIGVQWEFCNI